MANLNGPTNSLINNLMANSGMPVPAVGMGATRLMWTDRHPYTIIEVSKSGKTIKVQRDNYTRVDNNGMSESQTYEYTPDPDGSISVVTLRKNGRWVEQGGSARNGTSYLIGHREKYHDFSF